MFSQIGSTPFGTMTPGGGDAGLKNYVIGRLIALLGDPSNHGGSLIDVGGNTTVTVKGTLVALNGANHSCPIIGHGTTAVTAATVKSWINGKLILTYGAIAGCGAVLIPPNRKVTVEK